MSRMGKAWLAAVLGTALCAGAAEDTGRWGAKSGRYTEGRGQRDEGIGLGRLSPRMLRELGFTPDQEKKLREQRLAFEKRKIQLHGEKAMLELDLREVFSAHPVKAEEAAKLGEKIAEVEKKTLLLKIDAWARFLTALTPEQHRKLMDMKAELRERRRGYEGMEKGGGTEKGGR